jgi:ABC-type dipeptide/oligopeptide/nickel transport system ATPase component/ABC-type dipeptide/oligopeptide/nickel transport system permease subunit
MSASDAPLARASTLRRVLHNKMALLSLVLLSGIVLAVALAPLLTSQDPNFSSLSRVLLEPGTDGHLLGTDSAGRDIWARILYGGRISLAASLLALGVAVVIGVPTGLLGGYYGGRLDTVLNWFGNMVQSLPGIVILLAVRSVLGPSIWISMAVYGVIFYPSFFRIVRTAVINVRNELFVDAARVSGLSDLAIIGRHVLTVVRAPVIIQAALSTGAALAVQSGLEFLGVGDNAIPSWGNILNEGFTNIYRAPIVMLWPSLAIGVTCAVLVLLGNGLRDALEDRDGGAPKRSRRAKPRHVTAGTHAAAARPSDDPMDNAPTAIASIGPSQDTILSIKDLSVAYGSEENPSVVVEDVTIHVDKGEVLGLVGESGSGKTQTAFAALGLLGAGGRVLTGSITFEGTELTALSSPEKRSMRGTGFAYIPQEPMSNLDPVFKVGSQLVEPMRMSLGISRREAEERALHLLERVGIPAPRRTFDSYAHEISGGMAQRVLIAAAISRKPRLLIADEPTTALDVTVQAEVLDLLRDLQEEYQMAVVLVTHNFGVVADICDRVAVMRKGRIVEMDVTQNVFDNPQHPYTQMLLGSTLESGPSRIELDRQHEEAAR